MMTQTSDLFNYTVDRMIVRDRRIFGFGWIFHEESEIQSIKLELKLSDERTITLPISYRKLRDDVHRAYPESPHSLHCGFVVYGGWNARADVVDVNLVGSLEEGRAFKLGAPITNLRGSSRISSIRLLPYRVLLMRAWKLLARKNFKALRYKIKRYWPALPASNEDIRDASSRLLSAELCSRVMLVVDHDLGGGANTYREELVKEYLQEDYGILLLTYNLLSLQYVVDICTTQGRKRFSVSGLDSIVELAEEGLFQEVFYNNAVSFERPEDIPDLLAALKQTYRLPLTMAVHDYFTVCPSHFLLNSEGRYCGIPSLVQCDACLQKLDYGFVSLYESKSMESWRKKWGACYQLADRILCFSNVSRELIERAYPTVHAKQIVVKPHSRQYFPARKPDVDVADKLNIGIVGEIGFHKGSQVVQSLAEEITCKQLDVRISVIGSIETECDTRVVKETGPYEHSQLVELIETMGANVFFFPSIWPETFSYVIDELMQLGVPIVCFDLGAPAERVRQYTLGKVIPVTDAATILRGIVDFHNALAGAVLNR